MPNRIMSRLPAVGLTLALASGCSPEPKGLALADPAAKTRVVFDFFHEPLPEIPMPNDVATRYDPSSPTHVRVNAPLVCPSQMQRRERDRIDQLDGWGTFQPLTIPFSAPLDIESINKAHRNPADKKYDLSDDVIYLINVDPNSPHKGTIHHLDIGNGNYPVVVKNLDNYWKNDPRGATVSLPFEEYDEDKNGNGVLDPAKMVNGVLQPPEDTDADGLLDKPNYFPGYDQKAGWDASCVSAREAGATISDACKGQFADALMSFYDAQTHTLIARPMEPLDERTTYAVVVTKRLLDADHKPVGSPYKYINDVSQTEALKDLPKYLPAGLKLEDIAFTYSYTTQSTQSVFKAVRDGLYGLGVQKQLGKDFPAEIGTIERLRDDLNFPDMTKPNIVYSEQWLPAFEQIVQQVTNADPSTVSYKETVGSQKYVDFVVIGSYQSPQLFNRYDKDGNFLPLDEQSWPADLTTKAAAARAETVYFTLTVPRKEVSARKDGKGAPLVLMGHGYGSNRFEGLQLGGFFAKYGYATLSIDGPGHGLSIKQSDKELANLILSGYGLSAMSTALFKDRALNQDNDPEGRTDSGADFWTSYVFHTRDVVRQYELDLMQVARIVGTFDGSTKSKLGGLAGDFDGDGIVDVDGKAPMAMMGGSLGGIMSMLTGSLEPKVNAIIPISGGGGFSDMGVRTAQGGAVEGFILRSMGPLFVGTLTGESLALEQIVPDLNDAVSRPIDTVTGVHPWDTMIVDNLKNGERGCGYVSDRNTVRASIESDKGDAVRIRIYSGPQLNGDTKCGLLPQADAHLLKEIGNWAADVQFQWNKDHEPVIFKAGTPIVTLADGMGLRRAHPDLRRFLSIAQLVLDSGDPAVFAKNMQKEPLVYGNGEKTGAHALVITTTGDNAVPANSGVAFGRAAGLISYTEDEPGQGMSANQRLLESHFTEAECHYARYSMPSGEGTCADMENFAQTSDQWGEAVPRLNPPLHLFKPDPLGGVSAAIFPFTHPEGQHGFDLPGTMIDDVRSAAHCTSTCTATPSTDPCSCDAKVFDIGNFMLNMIGQYLKSGEKTIGTDLCQSADNCAFIEPQPVVRTGAEIDQ